LSPDFAKRIDAWELGEKYPKKEDLPLEQQARVEGALEGKSGKSQKSGNIFTLENDLGQDINYDVVTGERSLSVKGYSLSSRVKDKGDYYTPRLEYTKVLQENEKTINIIQKLYKALKEKKVEVQELAEIKETIRQIPEAMQL